MLVRIYGTSKWTYGKIEEKQGELHYMVNTGGRMVKRHVDQLRATEPEESNYPRVAESNESLPLLTTEDTTKTATSFPHEEMSVSVPTPDPPRTPVAPPGFPGSPGSPSSLGNPAGSPWRSVEPPAEIPVKKLPPRTTRGKVPARYQD